MLESCYDDVGNTSMFFLITPCTFTANGWTQFTDRWIYASRGNNIIRFSSCKYNGGLC